MKKIILGFFVFLGIIFFVLLIALGYVYMTNMFGVRTLFSGSNQAMSEREEDAPVLDKNPLLSPAQERTLDALGVDPATLPTTITPQMIECFNAKLGSERTIEIKNGSTPTPAEYFAVQSCF